MTNAAAQTSDYNIPITKYMVPKIIRLMAGYLSINIASNYMSQIYTENVLINNTDPPNLTNLVVLFFIIDLLINFVILVILHLLKKPLDFDDEIFKIYIIEYLIVLFAIFIQAYFVASIMYSKKYFLYKDDGLKGIRALKNIFYVFIIFYNILPFGWYMKDIDFIKNLKLT